MDCKCSTGEAVIYEFFGECLKFESPGIIILCRLVAGACTPSCLDLFKQMCASGIYAALRRFALSKLIALP